MNITWSIQKADVVESKDNLENVVTTIYWEATAKDTNVADKRHGSVCVALDKSKPFIPFDELTSEIYLDWVFNSAMSKSDVESDLKASIDRQKILLTDS
jgi:hypothetical protein